MILSKNMNKKQLMQILRRKFKGERISLRRLSKELDLGFDKLYSVSSELENEGIVTLKKIREVGRSGPVDVEIEAFTPPKQKNILEQPLFVEIVGGLFVLIAGSYLVSRYVVPKIDKIQEYSNKYNIAHSIYPEVLGNVRKIELCISKFNSTGKLKNDSVKFSTVLFTAHYKAGAFGGSGLDGQLANFYNGINSIDTNFKKVDYERVKGQGLSVLQLLEREYGCKNYDKVISSEAPDVMMAVSGVTVKSASNPIIEYTAVSSDTLTVVEGKN